MTPAEITAYVMALPVEDLRRLSATDVMGWELVSVGAFTASHYEGTRHLLNWKVAEGDHRSFNGWRPDEDRNQSRMVTDEVGAKDLVMVHHINLCPSAPAWSVITPDQECRAALIAHIIHTQEATNATEQ